MTLADTGVNDVFDFMRSFSVHEQIFSALQNVYGAKAE